MIEMSLPLAPDVGAPAAALDSVPVLEQLATLGA